LASAFEDGYAFVDYNGAVWGIQPPFTRFGKASREAVERAVANHGFDSGDGREFDSWQDLIDYMRDRYMESRGDPRPYEQQYDDILMRSDEAALTGYLDFMDARIKKSRDLSGIATTLQHLKEGLNRMSKFPEIAARSAALEERARDLERRRRPAAGEIELPSEVSGEAMATASQPVVAKGALALSRPAR
jgi:hypothetical protein